MKIIGVACGGFTSEREISLKSGNFIFNLIRDSNFECYKIDINESKYFVIDKSGNKFSLNKKNFQFSKNDVSFSFDYIINLVHGSPGEDGEITKKFEDLGISHSTCNSSIAKLTFNKKKCLKFAERNGIKTARSKLIIKDQDINEKAIEEEIGFPCFVKPNQSGSSFGISKVYSEKELKPAIKKALKEDNEILIESYLSGREVNVGVFKLNGKAEVLPITEVVSENDFFDYKAKYEGESDEITPAILPIELEKKVKKDALNLYTKLSLRGITRSEFIFIKNIPYFLEINTIPGMTKQSIIPQQFDAANKSLKKIILAMINEGLK
ncbi:MAG: D-alanine--D-alanine ligase [Flavobacteriaceae bacterium]